MSPYQKLDTLLQLAKDKVTTHSDVVRRFNSWDGTPPMGEEERAVLEALKEGHTNGDNV